MPDHSDIVQHAWDVDPPEKTLAGALEFLLQVIDVLPAQERAGLLLKPGGENIVSHKGQMVSAGRICYPDGQLYKILTDIPTTNGPGWANDGTVDPARYLAVSRAPEKPPDEDPDRPDVFLELKAMIDAVLDLQRQHTQTMMGLAGVVAALAEKKHPILRAADDAKFMGMTVLRKGQAVLVPDEG